MADELELKLNKWTALTDDDVDLRTIEGRHEAAKRRAFLKGISFEEALSQITLSFEKRGLKSVITPRVAKH